MEQASVKAPKSIRADLNTLHRQLEELSARLEAEKTSGNSGSKRNREPAVFIVGK